MKFIFIILLSLFCLNILYSQDNVLENKGYVTLTQEADEYYTKVLPAEFDLSGFVYFPPLYNQTHWVCNQAASSYYMMTFETNKLKSISSEDQANQFSVYFPWNFGNGGNGWYGDNYVITMEMLKELGVPKISDCESDLIRDSAMWISGYDKYYQAMHNRIGEYLRIKTNTLTGLNTLKAWVYDNCGSEYYGGTATFLANIASGGSTYFEIGNPEAGAYVITKCGNDALHARTIVGYNDDVCFDYNDDGQYTNDVDLNGDGIIDVRDYEKGGFKLAESNGTEWQGDGFCWIMYKCMADQYLDGGILNNYVHIIKPVIDYTPLLTAKIILKHESREKIKVKIGISSDTESDVWEYIKDFPIVNYQGGNKYMQGGVTEADKKLEFGLDITPLLEYFNENKQAKLFLIVDEADNGDVFSGEIEEFSVLDYSGDIVQEFTNSTLTTLINNNETVVSVNVELDELNKPKIITETLPVLSAQTQIWYDIENEGGKSPFKWELLPCFDVNYLNEDFDYFEGTKLTPESDYNDVVNLELPFSFPFDDKETDEIRINVDGYILPFSETNVWTQFREHLYPFFINESVIAPLARFRLISDMESGDGIWYESLQDTVKIRWQVSDTWAEAWTKADFGCELIADGTIRFSYGQEYLSNIFSNIGGVSFGNHDDNIMVWMDDIPQNGSQIEIVSYPIPENLYINNEGTLYGNPGVLNSYPIRVRVTDVNNISFTKRYELTTGVNMQVMDNEIVTIYPNPVSEFTTIKLRENVYGDIRFNLINSIGEIVFSDNFNNSDSYILNLNDYNNGVYIIELHINEKIFNSRLVKI